MFNLQDQLIPYIINAYEEAKSISESEEPEYISFFLEEKFAPIIEKCKEHPLSFFQVLNETIREGYSELNHLLTFAVNNKFFPLVEVLIESSENFVEFDISNFDNSLNILTSYHTNGRRTSNKPKNSLINTLVDGHSLLHSAALNDMQGHILNFLINKGGDVNLQNHRGNTALNLALMSDNMEALILILHQKINGEKHLPYFFNSPSLEDKETIIFQILLKSIKEIDKQDHKGETILHQAAQTCQNLEVLEFLLAEKPNLDIKNSEGKTPLHLAVSPENGTGNFSLVKALLDHGADPNSVDQDGNTPLHIISIEGNTQEEFIQMCEYLLEKGADTQRKNFNGLDVLQAAKKVGLRKSSISYDKELLRLQANNPGCVFGLSFSQAPEKTPGYDHYIKNWQLKAFGSNNPYTKTKVKEAKLVENYEADPVTVIFPRNNPKAGVNSPTQFL